MQVVALLAEGVDRNKISSRAAEASATSPSSRRAWIEIKILSLEEHQKEQSPSSRRAWIEMSHLIAPPSSRVVALLAEGVDRNRLAGSWNF